MEVGRGREGGREERGGRAENESHIYPNMCAKFGCGPTVVSKKRRWVQTDRQRKLQLYIVD